MISWDPVTLLKKLWITVGMHKGVLGTLRNALELVPDRRSGFHPDTRDHKYGFVSVNTKQRNSDQKRRKSAGFGTLEKYTTFRNIKSH